MYGDNLTQRQAGNQQQIQVTIRNLPNQATPEEILNYLELCGPIKTNKFVREEERFSAIVVYHDGQSAQICKRYLGDRYYRGRALTITSEIRRNYQSSGNQTIITQQQPQEDILKQVQSLRREQKKILIGLLHNISNEGKIFEMFLQSNPKLVENLLSQQTSD